MSEHSASRKKRAARMVVGSWALGGISLWKLITVDSDPYLWVVTALCAFGLAQWDQILSVFKSRNEKPSE